MRGLGGGVVDVAGRLRRGGLIGLLLDRSPFGGRLLLRLPGRLPGRRLLGGLDDDLDEPGARRPARQA